MCGIAGIISPNSIQFKNPIKSMTQSMEHRGPDAEHFCFFPNASFGHRRLSIIDLSSNGDQPMLSSDEKKMIVLNGEIYDYQNLKKKYSSYKYKTQTDTEVILAMYEEKGRGLLDELNGMFAFAIWDDEKQSIFAARDRFGEKPFYYAFGDNNEFIFASEIKAILASGLVKPKVNNEALFHFLKKGYVNTYQSIYSNIFSLPPAHQLTYVDGKIEVKRYYSIPAQDRIISLDDAVTQFNQLLDNAIQKQLVADVPVGAFLSGGLDSSTIVAKASQYTENLNTLAFGYENRSELPYAKAIAEKYNTNHTEILEKDIDKVEKIKKITPFFDEPFSDMSFIATYEICKAAAKNLKVMLSGDAGDELFGGYKFYKVEQEITNKYWYKKNMLKKILRVASKYRGFGYVTTAVLDYNSVADFHENSVRNTFSREEIKKLGIDAYFQQPYSFKVNPDSVNDMMRIDLENYVPGNMMVKSDRMAMSNSLEVRTPFLDVDFANFCISLPETLKVNTQEDKIILREACQELWSEEIRNRNKQGFGNSVKSAYSNDPQLSEFSDDILKNSNEKIFNYIDFEASSEFLNKDVKEWQLLQLAIWSINYSSFL